MKYKIIPRMFSHDGKMCYHVQVKKSFWHNWERELTCESEEQAERCIKTMMDNPEREVPPFKVIKV